jgi:hypothetical protein
MNASDILEHNEIIAKVQQPASEVKPLVKPDEFFVESSEILMVMDSI